MIEKLKSRKFLMALAGAVFVVLNEGLDLGVPEEVYNYLVGIIIAYIVGEAVVDVARARK